MNKLRIPLVAHVLLFDAAITIASAQISNSATSGFVPPTPAGASSAVTGRQPARPLPQTPHDPSAWGALAIKPPVTEAAVREYLAHRVPLFADLPSAQPPTLNSVQFMTVAQFRKITGVPNDLNYYAATAPLIYVTFNGPFDGVPAETGPPTKPFAQAYMIFDAVTGNLLGDGSVN